MVDVTINSTDNLTGEPQDSDGVAFIRDGTTVLTQKYGDLKTSLIPDPTARTAADTADTAATAAAAAAAAAQADADTAQDDIDDHEANHPAGGFDQAAVDGSIAAHTSDDDAHHTPVDISGKADQSDLDAHEASTHNTDATARAAADTVETEFDSHVANHPGGVGGVPADNTISRAKLTTALRDDVDAHADQTDLDAHEASTHNVDSTARSEALAAQAQITGHQSASTPHNTEITGLIEAHRAVATAHQQPGGGGGGLTAAAITALPAGATNSNTEIPSVHGGILGKISISNILAYMRSSVGLGPRVNPVPVADDAGKLPLVNTAEDGYTLSTLPYVPVPPPVDDQIIIGSGPLWTTTRLPQRSDSYPHVSRIPAALASSAPLVYLEHEYHEGGSRVDATLRISGDGVLAGYIDPRLGTRLGSINQASPVVRIRVILTGDTISRWDDIEFFEEETATEFTHIWLADSQYNLGPPYFARGLWHRQFDTEPLALQIDTDIAFNLRRSDNSFFHTDGLGIRFEAGFWQLFQVRQGGQYKYGHLGGPGIVHTRSVGEPLDEPQQAGELDVDNLGKLYIGLTDRHILTTDAAATSVRLEFDQYERNPDQYSDIPVNGGFTWIFSLGNREMIQIVGPTFDTIDITRSWYDTWNTVKDQWMAGSPDYNDAVANRDAVWLGGFRNQQEAAEEASHVISQAEFAGGRRIFYGHTEGAIQGVRQLVTYTQGTITVRVDGHWVGPHALVSDIETIANDILDDAVKVVANEAAATADGDRAGVLYLWP